MLISVRQISSSLCSTTSLTHNSISRKRSFCAKPHNYVHKNQKKSICRATLTIHRKNNSSDKQRYPYTELLNFFNSLSSKGLRFLICKWGFVNFLRFLGKSSMQGFLFVFGAFRALLAKGSCLFLLN